MTHSQMMMILRGLKSGRWLMDSPYLLLSLASLFWAGNLVFGRYAAPVASPIVLSCVRWGGSFLILFPFAWPHLRRDWAVIRKHMRLLAALGLANAISNTLIYWSLQYTEALNSLLLQSILPLLVAVWALVLYGDRLHRSQILGILASLTGVLVIVCRGSLGVLLSISFNAGDILVVCALVFFALYSALAKKGATIHPISALTLIMGLGLLWLLPGIVWEIVYGTPPVLSRELVAACAYIVVIATVLAYLCFNRGVQLIGPNRAAPFFHLMPVFGSFLAMLFLGEQLHFYHAVGYVLVIGGVVIAARKKAVLAASGV